MSAPRSLFRTSVSGGGEFRFSPPPPPSPYCEHAQDFAAWADRHCSQALVSPSLLTLNQAILQLTEAYFEHRAQAPKRHRALTGTAGHKCVFTVFDEAYQQLKRAKLALAPPPLVAPPPPPPPAPPPPSPPAPLVRREPRSRFDGLLVGEIAEDEFR